MTLTSSDPAPVDVHASHETLDTMAPALRPGQHTLAGGRLRQQRRPRPEFRSERRSRLSPRGGLGTGARSRAHTAHEPRHPLRVESPAPAPAVLAQAAGRRAGRGRR